MPTLRSHGGPNSVNELRIAVLTTSTNNTVPLYAALSRMGHRLTIVIYDEMMSHSSIEGIIEATGADMVVYIGAIPHHHGKPVPGPTILAGIGAKWPMVHICCDGAEPAWWPVLQEYYDRSHFALQVNIDGVRTGPIGGRGITALCPADPEFYGDPPPWRDRPIRCGFPGAAHLGERARMLGLLVGMGVVTHRPRNDAEGSGDGYRRFLHSCRSVWNCPETGGLTNQHVKARVIEASLAGCLVLERKGSPLENWFEPGTDYVAYADESDVVKILDAMDGDPGAHEAMARSMRAKVIAHHSPDVFWSVVLGRLGLGPHVRPKQPPKLQHWQTPITQQQPQPIIVAPRPVGNPALMSARNHMPPPTAIPDGPPAIVGTLYNVNLISYGGAIYTAPQRLGPVDVTVWHPEVRSFRTLAAAQRAVKVGTVR